MAMLDDRAIETLLERAARSVSYPATPAVHRDVLDVFRLRTESPRREPRIARRALVAAVVMVLVVALGSMLAVPGARSAVAEFFGIVQGQRIEVVPDSNATSAPALTPQSLGTFALPVSRDEAHARLDFAPTFLDTLGEPEGIYSVVWTEQPVLILQYDELDLWQTLGEGFVGKGIGQQAILEQTTVHGQPAWWIVSSGHQMAFYDRDGNEVLGSRRVVDRHALIWNGRDGRYYRMETELPLEEALALASLLP